MGIFQSSFAAGQFFSAIAITAAAHAAGGVLPGFQILGAITLGAALPAYAADAVTARLEARGEYSRLVFAWPAQSWAPAAQSFLPALATP